MMPSRVSFRIQGLSYPRISRVIFLKHTSNSLSQTSWMCQVPTRQGIQRSHCIVLNPFISCPIPLLPMYLLKYILSLFYLLPSSRISNSSCSWKCHCFMHILLLKLQFFCLKYLWSLLWPNYSVTSSCWPHPSLWPHSRTYPSLLEHAWIDSSLQELQQLSFPHCAR